MGDPEDRGAYRFGPFQLDVRERRLSRGTEVIPLRLKVFDTLCVLVENAGRLVTKQELLETIWPDTIVEENNLNHNISMLRKALGEKATGQQDPSKRFRVWVIDSWRRSKPPSRPPTCRCRRWRMRMRPSRRSPRATTVD